MFHAIVQVNHPTDVATSPAVYLPGLFRSRGERDQDAVAAVLCSSPTGGAGSSPESCQECQGCSGAFKSELFEVIHSVP